MNIVNNIISHTCEFVKRVDFTLRAFIIKSKRRKEETSIGYECVYSIDCDDDFMGIYFSLNSSSCIHKICTHFFVHHKLIKCIFQKKNCT